MNKSDSFSKCFAILPATSTEYSDDNAFITNNIGQFSCDDPEKQAAGEHIDIEWDRPDGTERCSSSIDSHKVRLIEYSVFFSCSQRSLLSIPEMEYEEDNEDDDEDQHDDEGDDDDLTASSPACTTTSSLSQEQGKSNQDSPVLSLTSALLRRPARPLFLRTVPKKTALVLPLPHIEKQTSLRISNARFSTVAMSAATTMASSAMLSSSSSSIDATRGGDRPPLLPQRRASS